MRVRCIAFFMLLVFCSVPLAAQDVPNGFTYQGKLTDAKGMPVQDGKYAMTFNLYDSQIARYPYWTMGPVDVAISGGLFTVVLAPLSAADLAKSEVWLSVSVRAAPVAKIRLYSAPFAIRAQESVKAQDAVNAENAVNAQNADKAKELVLPLSQSYSYFNPIFSMDQTGAGSCGMFTIHNPAGSGHALYAYTNGTGDAFHAFSTGAGKSICGEMTGLGYAGYFSATNSNNINPAVYATGNTKGSTLEVHNSGLGTSGSFRIDNSSNGSHALFAYTPGLGNAVYAKSSGTSQAVLGMASGSGGAALFTVDNASNTETCFKVIGYGKGKLAHFMNQNTSTGQPAVRVENSGSGPALEVSNYGTGTGLLLTNTNANNVNAVVDAWANASGYAGSFGGSGQANGVRITVPSGNVGLIVSGGTKNAVVATSKGSRLLYAEEAAEVWFTDYGFGKLENGRTTITIDPLFAETVNLNEPYHVFIQPNDPDCEGMAVVNKTPAGFDVVELRKGTSNAEFSYRLVARREGYEKDRLKHVPDMDDDPNLYPEKKYKVKNTHLEKTQD